VTRFGEQRTAALDLVFSVHGMACYASHREGLMVYAVIVGAALESLVEPPLPSIASAHVPPSAQGDHMGAHVYLLNITTIVALLIFTQILGHFTRPEAAYLFSGAPYALAGSSNCRVSCGFPVPGSAPAKHRKMVYRNQRKPCAERRTA
jgi:DHA1 family tetracycline resistance protein-like MFS transporter